MPYLHVLVWQRHTDCTLSTMLLEQEKMKNECVVMQKNCNYLCSNAIQRCSFWAYLRHVARSFSNTQNMERLVVKKKIRQPLPIVPVAKCVPAQFDFIPFTSAGRPSRAQDEAKKWPLLLSSSFSFPRVLLQIQRIRLRLF